MNTKTVYIQKDIRTPYVQNWHFTIQRELAKDLVLDVGYAGNHSVGLWVTADLNQALPNLAGQVAAPEGPPSERAVRLHRRQLQRRILDLRRRCR